MGRAAPRRVRIGRASPARQQNKCACRRSARPSIGDGREHRGRTRGQKRAAGTKKSALFDIVSLRRRPTVRFARRDFARSCPGRAKRDPGPRSFTAQSMDIEMSRRVASGSRVSFRSRKCARYTRPGHEGVVSRTSERQRAKIRDPGATRRDFKERHACRRQKGEAALRDSCAGSRVSFRSRKRARCTRPGHEV